MTKMRSLHTCLVLGMFFRANVLLHRDYHQRVKRARKNARKGLTSFWLPNSLVVLPHPSATMIFVAMNCMLTFPC